MTGLRVAFSLNMGYAPLVNGEVGRLVKQAAAVFSDLGCVVTEDHPRVENPLEVFATLTRASYRHLLRSLSGEDKERLGPVLTAMLKDSEAVSLEQYLDVKDRIYALAQTLSVFHEKYDLLITPTVATPAFDANRSFPAEFEGLPNPRAWSPFTSLFNMTEQPAISIPVGFAGNGLPVGMQVVGPRGADDLVLTAAAHYLKSRDLLALPGMK